jgi:hypothetical protein
MIVRINSDYFSHSINQFVFAMEIGVFFLEVGTELLNAICTNLCYSRPDEVDFFTLPNHTSRAVALGSTQPLTEMSTRKLPGRPARRAENLTAICEPIF